MGKVLQLDSDVLDILGRATVTDGLLVLPGEQLDRKLYLQVNKALEAIGGKWNRSLGGHVLSEPDRLAALLEDGQAEAIDNLGYFPTPPGLVDRLLELAEVEAFHTALEPSAGRGAISRRLLEIVGPDRLHAVELQEKHAAALRVDHPNLIVGDFLTASFPWRFDRVVMNPPFERLQDIDHVVHAFDLLAPGGRLVSVMGAGATGGRRRKCQEFREMVERCGRVEPNPDGSFKASGTNVRTITVVLSKPGTGKEDCER